MTGLAYCAALARRPPCSPVPVLARQAVCPTCRGFTLYPVVVARRRLLRGRS